MGVQHGTYAKKSKHAARDLSNRQRRNISNAHKREDDRDQTYLTGPIDEVILVKDIHWFGFPQTAGPSHSNSPHWHLIARFLDHLYPVTHIASQSNVSLSFHLSPGHC